jgi:hypothetical protein
MANYLLEDRRQHMMKNLLGLRRAARPEGTDVETELCRKSAIRRPSRGTAARKIDSLKAKRAIGHSAGGLAPRMRIP